jgi:hypothetical protein
MQYSTHKLRLLKASGISLRSLVVFIFNTVIHWQPSHPGPTENVTFDKKPNPGNEAAKYNTVIDATQHLQTQR